MSQHCLVQRVWPPCCHVLRHAGYWKAKQCAVRNTGYHNASRTWQKTTTSCNVHMCCMKNLTIFIVCLLSSERFCSFMTDRERLVIRGYTIMTFKNQIKVFTAFWLSQQSDHDNMNKNCLREFWFGDIRRTVKHIPFMMSATGVLSFKQNCGCNLRFSELEILMNEGSLIMTVMKVEYRTRLVIVWLQNPEKNVKIRSGSDPVETSCVGHAELNSGIQLDKSTAEALRQSFQLSSASN